MTLYCGNVLIVIDALSTTAGRTKWGYLVTLEGQPLCAGEELETHASRTKEEAAAELIGFMMESSEEQQREWGWEPIDQDKLLDSLHTNGDRNQTVYVISDSPSESLDMKYGLMHCPKCTGLADPVEEITELIEYDEENEDHEDELPDGSPAVKYYCQKCRIHFMMYLEDTKKEDVQDVENHEG